MARKKNKNVSVEEELELLNRESEECEEKIKSLSERRKELKQIIEQKQMEMLYQAALQSGKDIKEVIALINADIQEETVAEEDQVEI